jgi:hypothetical protein
MIATSTRDARRPTRAGILLIALALVGGTGCITSSIIDRAQQQRHMREEAEAHKRRIAQLTPAADAGDPVAATALAHTMMSGPPQDDVDQARVLALLSRAAGQGYAPAQAMLGEILVSGNVHQNYRQMPLAREFQDRERGLQLLRQAASGACAFMGYFGVRPATLLAQELARDKRTDEARLWRARAALHCGQPAAGTLSSQLKSASATPERTEALALLLLQAPDAAVIAKDTAALPAEEVAAARREAAQLREQVAQSERQYPAPRQKETH